MGRLKSVNNGQTTLNANITAAATSFTVASASVFPNAPFKITIDGEIMEVTAIDKASNTLTSVLRGQEGTAAATHNTGASVENRWTAGTHAELTDVTHTHDGGAGNGPKLNPATAFTYVPPAMTTAELTYYVDSVNGNDANAGTAAGAGNALKTIQAAINKIPQLVNHPVTINVQAGIYAEAVSIVGFGGKESINITNVGGAVSINNMVIQHCSTRIIIVGITATTTTETGFYIGVCRWVYLNLCIHTAVNTTVTGCYVYGSNAVVANCTFSNKYAGIYSASTSKVYSYNNAGTGNSFGYFSNEGSSIGYIGTTVSGPQYSTSGGIIVGDMGVTNPWGDNTTSQRSGVDVWPAGAFTLTSGGVSYKLPYGSKTNDNLNEWNTSTYRYTAQKAGRYIISAKLVLVGAPSDTRLILMTYINGSKANELADGYGGYGAGNDMGVTGTIVQFLNAGDYVEFYGWSSVGGLQWYNAGDITWAKFLRIA